MKKLLFATNNAHKLEEVKQLLSGYYEVISLSDVGFEGEIPETSPTIEGNALQKARFIKQSLGLDCFADDTGLEVAALHGAPGVYSARYAGEGCSYDDNVTKMLLEMQGIAHREARFRTVIALIIGNEEKLFEGIVEGMIIQERKGASGFGYDPIFMPEGYNQTFAEMATSLKNEISHRGRAVKLLAQWLMAMKA
ncbi:MAG: non-canonical purine NTP diphosphatase [Lentimicrobium sp.]|jgi:XTP/dITP diphosphohydrolase|nr:non-canonical purine NTP diphosphatase [Lentimicrobium sp.]MDD2526744.1 non-canonical purine NTP diphosphatase [Lentimicrobiaceae bacterium]MDD4596468.1 non-canonical purine NTP diphosphatase [Lentimicrobiaceae bacterium]MDY0024710.1 non-canonical purine NTP diphosphatase [Lentimicrobium sp.]HAH57857.1 non-canonical purine NTP pyrophosphatase [Bacteroidales bacterium]